MPSPAATVYIVDDDPSVLRSLARLVGAAGCRVETFDRAAGFLESRLLKGPSCLVLDFQMPELSGLELQRELATRGLTLPVIFLTGHGDVPSSVEAMKAGALDFRCHAERLRALALALGADLPFFLDPRPALVGGIGERIEPVAGLPGFTLLLAHPGVPLATSAVYAQYDAGAGSLTPPGPGPSIRALLALREEARALQSLVVNDLEPAATLLCPAVAELRKEIEATGASAVSLSGSGPTVFGVFASEDAAGEARRRITRRAGLRTWVVKTAPSDAAAPGPRPAGA